eukprot:1512175-Rhodomonas_salina.3
MMPDGRQVNSQPCSLTDTGQHEHGQIQNADLSQYQQALGTESQGKPCFGLAAGCREQGQRSHCSGPRACEATQPGPHARTPTEESQTCSHMKQTHADPTRSGDGRYDGVLRALAGLLR